MVKGPILDLERELEALKESEAAPRSPDNYKYPAGTFFTARNLPGYAGQEIRLAVSPMRVRKRGEVEGWIWITGQTPSTRPGDTDMGLFSQYFQSEAEFEAWAKQVRLEKADA